MKMWRLGLAPLPGAYVAWHEYLAKAAIDELKEDGWVVHRVYMADDGWMDGMRFIHVIIEHYRTGALRKVKWSDSQLWYTRPASGVGWVLFDPEEETNQWQRQRNSSDAT